VNPPVSIGGVAFGGGQIGWILGPCSLESETISLTVAEELLRIRQKLGLPIVFKGSFDKANRLRLNSPRGPGIEQGLKILEKVRALGLPVLTDIHEPYQAEMVAPSVDAIQIPAFLARQTDLALACARTQKPVFIKKGQFMSPEDMKYVVEKIRGSGNPYILVGERGTFFGYRDLVVDFRSLIIMRNFAPVVYDATHSVQVPGGGEGMSGGNREFVEPLARAALALGVDGIFMETHPDPDQAISDRKTQIPLKELEKMIERLLPYASLRAPSSSPL
jgi:2-dehydro-3-deoxyphosphooctonate aldolase (KDO 8-P synthase)